MTLRELMLNYVLPCMAEKQSAFANYAEAYVGVGNVVLCEIWELNERLRKVRGREPVAATLGLKKLGVNSIIQLTNDEQRVLNEYISSGSYKINEVLRQGTRLKGEQEQFVAQLDSALDKMPTYEGTVYRSLDSAMMNEDLFWQEHTLGNIVIYPAYTSTSTTVYDESMDIQLVIQSKTGVDMRKYNQSEQEILFARNSKFKVIKREGRTLWLEEI